MSDKVQLIKEEIERRIKNLEFSLENNCVEKHSKLDILGNITTLESLLQFIDSLPEEPASEDLEEEIKNYFSDWLIDLNNHKGFLIQFAHHFAEWGRNHFEDKSEMVSEDLEEVADKYAENHGFRVPYDGSNKFYDDVDVKASKEGFIAGAEWQRKKDQETIELAEDHAMLGGMNKMKEEMMKDAVETIIVNDWQYGKDPDHAVIPAIHQRIKGFNVGDKVKIIIVKEEQQ